MKAVARKHLLAEQEVRPLLDAAARVDAAIVRVFPRPLGEILGASFPGLVIERVDGLTEERVRQVLWDRCRRTFSGNGNSALAGFTYASGDLVVVLVETQHGPANEAFTLAHEMGHLAKEFLKSRGDGRQLELFTCGPSSASPFVHADPPTQTGPPAGAPPSHRVAWLREVVANACAAELLAAASNTSRATRFSAGDQAWAGIRPLQGRQERGRQSTGRAREIGDLVSGFQRRVACLQGADEMWSLETYLREARRAFDAKYDYRYSVLISVFGRLLAEQRVAEHDLAGLSPAKLDAIRAVATAWGGELRRA